MTVIARRFTSIPDRTASATWSAISELLAADPKSEAAVELASVAGIASSIISREAMTVPIVVCGSGPRVRVYCLYNEDAVDGDDTNETALSFNPTEGNWKMSLPCPTEDLSWVQGALKLKSQRITARDMNTAFDSEEETNHQAAATESTIDLEAFLKS